MKQDKLETITKLFEGKEIRSIWNSKEEEYYFSYEYIIREQYLYGGVISSKGTKVVEKIFGPEGYDIRPMTREEFEGKYLIDRITTVNFPTEIEMVDYCNKMRNIFNNQEK